MRHPRSVVTILLALPLTALAPISCSGDLTTSSEQNTLHFEPEYETFHDLVSMTKEADLIVVATGRQLRVENLPGDSATFSVSELTITDMVRGQRPAEPLELWQLGTVDSNMAPTLVGERPFLLFLTHYDPPALEASDSRVTPVGGTQGVYLESAPGHFVIVGEGRPTSNPAALDVDLAAGSIALAP